MIIERTDDEILVRIPSNINIDEIQNILDLIQYREIVSKSKATQEQIEELALEAKKNIWKNFKKERNIS